MKKYTGPAVKVSVEREEGSTAHLWIRPKAEKVIIPGRGKISLPEYLAEQSKLSLQLEKLVKAKIPAPLEIREVRSQLTLPDMLASSQPGDDTSLYDVRNEENDFSIDSVEEATAEVLALREENAALKLELEKKATAEVLALREEVEALKLELDKKTNYVPPAQKPA